MDTKEGISNFKGSGIWFNGLIANPPSKEKVLDIGKVSLMLAIFLFLFSIILLSKAIYFAHMKESIFWAFYSFITSAFLLSRIPLSYLYEDRHESNAKSDIKYPSTSFIIAVKNEEDSIYDTIKSCLASEYNGKKECIVVNDGSTDDTLKEIYRAKKDFKDSVIKIISFSENRGKREAMAEGILISKMDVVAFVDSDSFVKPDALRILNEHFLGNREVAAVSGNTIVRNADSNILTKMQSVRYAASFDIFKTSESVFGTVTCCPGCFSAYKRKLLLPILSKWRNQKMFGSRSTFGDDRSLTNFVLRGHKVIYCKSAVAETIVPDTYMKFLKQQLRWKKSWIREGLMAASFMWRKNFFAAASFYANLFLPILGPILVARIVYKALESNDFSIIGVFVLGVALLGLLFGVYLNITQRDKNYLYMPVFSLFYMFFLVWQIPLALIKINDTRWGTR